MPFDKTCKWCGIEFIADKPAALYCCPKHKTARRGEYDRGYKEYVRGTDQYKAIQARYRKSSAGRAAQATYDSSSKGLSAHIRWCTSQGGKAFWRSRYERLGNNTHWRDKANYWKYVEGRPCAFCGEAAVFLLQCDHIIPRAPGGSDEDSNLQILCIKCHAKKTAVDIAAIRERLGPRNLMDECLASNQDVRVRFSPRAPMKLTMADAIIFDVIE